MSDFISKIRYMKKMGASLKHGGNMNFLVDNVFSFLFLKWS